MAQLNLSEVNRLARLARIRLSEAEAKAFLAELNAILEYVTSLQAVKTTGVEPTAQVTGLTNVMRPDKLDDYGLARPADLLANAPAREKGFIKVRRVLGEK